MFPLNISIQKYDKGGGEEGRLHIGTRPMNSTFPLVQRSALPCLPAPGTGPGLHAAMLAVVRFSLLPAVKLYLLGLKVLLVQLFSRPFRLPGQFR